MHQNNGVGTLLYCPLENLPRMNEGRVECSNRDELGFGDLVFCVQVEHKKMLLCFIRNSPCHILENIACSLNFLILITAVMESLVQFEDGNDLHCFGLSDSLNLLKFLDRYI